MGFAVSIIIPVYNAARFVEQAVESALAQPETDEVILVEDHSPDNSLEICQGLAEKFPKVCVYQHPGGVNRGAGPSRNLGMEKSTCPFITFLDADDYFLPGRFIHTGKIFDDNPDCDGVYEAVGIHFEDEQAKQRWMESDMGVVRMTTINRIVPSEELFRVLIKGDGSGHIHLNGLVIKRSLLEKSGMMNDKIADTLHEDTDFILKAAAAGKMLPGSIAEPISIRRVHAENRVSAQRPAKDVYRDHFRQRLETYRWCKSKDLREHRKLVFKRMLGDCLRDKPYEGWITRLPEDFAASLKLFVWPLEFPEAVLEGYYWMDLLRTVWGILKNRSIG